MSEPAPNASAGPALEAGAYEVIRRRLDGHAEDLRLRLERLDADRAAVFGGVETALLATARLTTENNCVPRDLASIGQRRFAFGYNVHLGLRTNMRVEDVFAVHDCGEEDKAFHAARPSPLDDPGFREDFTYLYRYYKNASFLKFHRAGPHLYFVMRVGRGVEEVKCFKWLVNETDATLTYLGNRFDHEFVFPPRHEFEWKRAARDHFRPGGHPHVSIEDRVFVETIHGDLTVKVEDNTESGQGVYSEPVDNPDQQLDDAEIHYAIIGNLILLRILPYQEKQHRHLLYNERTREVHRIDSIAQSCVLLPDQHGILFPDGYALQSGEVKRYPVEAAGLRFERKIAAANGEDTLFVFHDLEAGRTLLLSYNLIRQTLATPLVCNGMSLFANGEMLVFLGDPEPRKHHVVQIWRTPYLDEASSPPKSDSFLGRLGNAEIVRAMAECRGLLTLLGKQDTFSGLYVDLARDAGDIADGYFWVDRPEAHNLKEPLLAVKAAAEAALGEFEKVRRMRKSAADQTEALRAQAARAVSLATAADPPDITGYVSQLTALRELRGKILALRDVRYSDPAAVEAMEKSVATGADALSAKCTAFLVQPAALDPYRDQITTRAGELDAVRRAAEAAAISGQLDQTGAELELLTGIVSSLKIQDATETTRIIENISELYARLNQVRAKVRNRKSELARLEGAGEFQAQLSLLNQAVVNQLETANTPARCDEALTRMLVQIEEIEGRFAEFDEFLPEISAKREEVQSAFQARRQSLVEARNKRCEALAQSAARILTGLRSRAASFASAEELHAHLAADPMAAKLRDLAGELQALGDSVRADDLLTRLKTLREDALKQIRDKAELFEDGGGRIRLGRHSFSVNRQPLELAILPRDGALWYHLSGTAYFEKIEDAELTSFQDLWEQEVSSETPVVYRGETLAWRLLLELEERGEAAAFAARPPEERLARVREFMHLRYREGYTKGEHDSDALAILTPLLQMRESLGPLRHAPAARGLALLFWHAWPESDEDRGALTLRMRSGGRIRELFGTDGAGFRPEELDPRLRAFFDTEPALAALAAEAGLPAIRDCLLDELRASTRADQPLPHTRGTEALELQTAFRKALVARRADAAFDEAFAGLARRPAARFLAVLDWLRAALPEPTARHPGADLECAALMVLGAPPPALLPKAPATRATLTGLHGAHPRVVKGSLELDYHEFIRRLTRHDRENTPRFEAFHRRKHALLEARRAALRLHEFKASVLSSFVRNRLLDQVYLPLIGGNLAKQIGAAGADTRTDRMGLLLLISPPGYGKTTLMEYVANRLGITFVKVNGPAIGHRVTSLDPAEAPNASAREEIEKLNLAFEMGDNVMIYVDDIQHTHPEFLQKFISLCDGQRKIEGVFRGRARTYDLRGRKVAVVMAGNPYTEVGGKFQIPDMLANRADTFNLGDILGGHESAFRDSYIENALTSNPVLARVAARSHADALAVLKIASEGSREGVEFEANHSPEEIQEAVDLTTRLLRVRDVMLRVNQEYIRSAATEDAYRTEPPFKLQGSYRNMNRIVEKLQPLMTEAEVNALVEDHYRGEAQSLSQAAEANLLKWREITGRMSPADAKRWDDIRRSFRRNLLAGGSGENDPVSRITGNLAALGAGLDRIGQAVDGITQPASLSDVTVARLREIIEGLRAVPVDVQIQVLPVERPAPGELPVDISAQSVQGKPRS
jgi:hypothetical protein